MGWRGSVRSVISARIVCAPSLSLLENRAYRKTEATMLKKAKFECVPTLGGSLAQDVGILRDNVYHYHPEWELDYVVAGVGNILVGNEIVPYCVGSMDLIASNVPHFYSCLEDKTRESRTMVLKFNYENVIAPLEGIPEFASVVRLFSETGVALRFPVNVAYRDDLERIFQASPADKILLFWKMLLDVSALKVERVAAREPNFRLDLLFSADNQMQWLLLLCLS